MALAPGTKVGPYEIVAAIGAGGMGEVYHAKDTRLGREVAIKFLAAHLSTERDRERFQREARIISQLSHAHICALHDIGQHQGADYLVMEFLEGESLAERLQRGALPIRQTLEYGAQVAEALECAHRAGVVHRDLKPGNIMLTKSGVKLLDFGLAKPALTNAAVVDTPTVSKPLTEEGTIVGTHQYMAPEQVEGKEADARSDIFSLGTVLYEMTTGRRAFTGKSRVSVMSAILEREPEPMSAAQPMTPPALEHAVRTCLAKEAEQRWQSAADLARELRWIAQGGSSASAAAPISARRAGKRYWQWVAVAVIAIATGIAGYVMHPATTSEPVWASLNLNGELYEEGSFVLSPDGTRVAYVAADPQGQFAIFVRRLDEPKPQELEGTAGAEYPFWSPDGRQIGFFAELKMKRVDASGQNVQVIADAPNGRGGTWNSDGVILFAPNAGGGLARVNASGGTVTPLTKAETPVSHRFPYFMPDGRHFLLVLENGTNVAKEQDGIYAGSLDSSDISPIKSGETSNVTYFQGRIFFVRDGELITQPFDAAKMQATGEESVISQGVRWASDRRTGDYSIANGALLFLTAPNSGQRLVWFDRGGKDLGLAVADIGNGTTGTPEGTLSPDGTRAAVIKTRGKGSDLWIYDLKTGVGTRLTFSADPDFIECPVWSPDGTRITFLHNYVDHYEIRVKAVSGAGQERMLVSDKGNILPMAWSPDGHYLYYNDRIFGPGKARAMAIALEGEHKPFQAAESTGNVIGGAFSPDGKWLLYISDESGTPAAYATTFPDHNGKWQVSSSGCIGLATAWLGRNNDTEVICEDLQLRLISVPVRIESASLSMGAPQALLGGRALATSKFVDITRDRKRVLLGLPQENASTPLTLVLNWKGGSQ